MELVKTISFDEFMEEYYELNNTNNVDVDKSLTENDYEVDKESGIITRRDFLKYSALGTATLIMGASTEKAEAVLPLIIGAIALGAAAWASDEYIDWEITIGNPNRHKGRTEHGNFELVKTSDYDPNQRYANLDSTNETFYIPAGKACTFRNTSLRASVSKDISALVSGSIGSKTLTSNLFRILRRV